MIGIVNGIFYLNIVDIFRGVCKLPVRIIIPFWAIRLSIDICFRRSYRVRRRATVVRFDSVQHPVAIGQLDFITFISDRAAGS